MDRHIFAHGRGTFSCTGNTEKSLQIEKKYREKG